MPLLLRKAIIKEKLTNTIYLAEDIFDQEIITVILSGKLRMNYVVLNIGKKVYVTVDDSESTKGRLTIGTDFKQRDELFRLKVELDQRVEGIE